MLSVKGIRNACPRCSFTSLISIRRDFGHSAAVSQLQPNLLSQRHPRQRADRFNARTFSSSRYLRQDQSDATVSSREDIEKVVRDAKQRFRDTLPKGYLNDE